MPSTKEPIKREDSLGGMNRSVPPHLVPFTDWWTVYEIRVCARGYEQILRKGNAVYPDLTDVNIPVTP